jgi:hypothetical protein
VHFTCLLLCSLCNQGCFKSQDNLQDNIATTRAALSQEQSCVQLFKYTISTESQSTRSYSRSSQLLPSPDSPNLVENKGTAWAGLSAASWATKMHFVGFPNYIKPPLIWKVFRLYAPPQHV